MLARRQCVRGAAATLAACGSNSWAISLGQAQSRAAGAEGLPAGAVEAAVLHALPGKRPLIKRTFRPPNYETLVEVLNETFTPNDAFFVRYYHLPAIPEVAAEQWQVSIGGEAVQQPLTLTLRDLRERFEQVEVAAVCQCAGNRRGLFQPHVPGVRRGRRRGMLGAGQREKCFQLPIHPPYDYLVMGRTQCARDEARD